MTTTAIIMMIVAMLTIWGGLIAAILNLNTRGNASAEDIARAELQRDL
ncbi:MAG: methionine/alanine import family NSS transporter small subunit [Janibacter sp.]|nr:methionine/alanine import family NSS transporter small subunit [Janibacter sp.]